MKAKIKVMSGGDDPCDPQNVINAIRQVGGVCLDTPPTILDGIDRFLWIQRNAVVPPPWEFFWPDGRYLCIQKIVEVEVDVPTGFHAFGV